METYLTRKDIPDKYKWDLTKIYLNNLEFEEHYKFIEKEISKILDFENKSMNNSKNLLNLLSFIEKLEQDLEKIIIYSSLFQDEDLNNEEAKKLNTRTDILYTKYLANSSFIDPKITKLNLEEIEKLIKEEPKLSKYDLYLKRKIRKKSHTLSVEEEKIISELSTTLSSFDEIYTALADSDFTFNDVEDSKGKIYKLNHGTYAKLLENDDSVLRKNVFNETYKVYKNNKNTLGSLIINEVNKNVKISRIRKYKSSLEAKLFDNYIPISVYNNLIETVNKNQLPVQKYFRHINETRFNGNMHLYDQYTRDKIKEEKITVEEGLNLIKESLKPLGPEYQKLLNKAIDERWIDYYYTTGKKAGAYSSSGYKTNPYILMNYNNNMNSVKTLAHELGHSIHSYYSTNNNDYFNYAYKIFVAEVASTVNEIFVTEHILMTVKNKKEKRVVLEQFINNFKSTFYRQTMFAEFEKEIYEKVESDQPLTEKEISEIYYNLNKKYFGDSIIIDEDIKYEWSRIPHFYSCFYVYQYATGISAAIDIVTKIMNKEDNAVENYIDFLKVGNSLNPIEALKIAGVNIENKLTINNSIKYFEEKVDQLIKIDKEGE